MSDNEKLPIGRSVCSCCMFHWRGKLTLLVPLLALPVLIYGLVANKSEFQCLYLAIIMCIYWLTECIPLYITSLLPVMFLPAFNILSSDICCSLYFSNTLIMLLGGLLLGLAIEYSSLDERIALRTILFFGCRPRRLHLGVLLITCFISNWIPNSAATALMCPIIKEILIEMNNNHMFNVYKSQEEEPTEDPQKPHPSDISMAFYIGASYAASIGGCGTLLGTGTNLAFKGIYEIRFPYAKDIVTFSLMILYSMPLVVFANIILVYISFQFTHMGLCRPKSIVGRDITKANHHAEITRGVVREHLKSLGPMSCHEIQVLVVFLLMVALVITCRPHYFKGWGDFLNAKDIQSSVPIMLSIVLMFGLPTQYTFFKYCCGKPPFTGRTMDACLSWQYVHTNLPWGFLFLIGGGYALAEGIIASGLSKMIGDGLKFFSVFPEYVNVAWTLFISFFVTAFSPNNVAICNILVPIFCEMAVAVEMHPLLLTLPSMMAISLAYFFPMSTPPNAIICDYANIKTKYLVVAGIVPTIIGFFLLWINAITYGLILFPACKEFPKWAY